MKNRNVVYLLAALVVMVSLVYLATQAAESDSSANRPSIPAEDLPHAKMPAELQNMRVMELDNGQSAWIGTHFVRIDEKRRVWVDHNSDVYLKEPDSLGCCLKIKRMSGNHVELILPRSNIRVYPTIYKWSPQYISGGNWRVSKFTIAEDE